MLLGSGRGAEGGGEAAGAVLRPGAVAQGPGRARDGTAQGSAMLQTRARRWSSNWSTERWSAFGRVWTGSGGVKAIGFCDKGKQQEARSTFMATDRLYRGRGNGGGGKACVVSLGECNSCHAVECGRGDSARTDSWRLEERPAAWPAVASEEQWRGERRKKLQGKMSTVHSLVKIDEIQTADSLES